MTLDIGRQYNDLVNAVGEMKDQEDGMAFLRRVSEVYGLKDVVYLGFDLPDTKELYYLGTYAPQWVDHYRSSHFERIDPVVAVGFSSILPSTWDGMDYRKNRKVRRFFGEAADFGVADLGITFPIRGRHGEKALLTLSVERDKHWNERVRAFMRDFQLLSFHLHTGVMRDRQGTTEIIDLSPRERECLKWASVGKSYSEIGIILALSEHTVRFYMEAARSKLNTINTTHAVAKAVRFNLI